MWRVLGALFGLLAAVPAQAQSTARVGYAADGNGSQPFTYVSSTTPLPVSGSFSAGSFAPGGSFATVTSTASSADAALPTGTTVALFNTGTTAVSCNLTVGAGSSTANKNIIQASSWFAVVPGSNTHFSCINQAGDGASNVVVASGGSGLPAGAGGGGSGGGGGTVTQGNAGTNAQAWWVRIGDSTNGPVTVGTYGSAPGAVAALNVNASVTNANANGQNTMVNSSPVVLASNQSVADPCVFQTKTNLAIATSSGTVQLVAPSGSTQVYVCSFSLIAASTAVINLVGGTGATCTTGTPVAAMGSTTAASGLSLAANGGLTFGNGGATVTRTTTAGHGLCLIQSGTTALAGSITYVQQ